MRTSQVATVVLLLGIAAPACGADRISVTKTIPASAGPWVVTPVLNPNYEYGGGRTQPVVFDATDGFGFRTGDVLTIEYAAGMWCWSTTVTAGTCRDANGYQDRVPANDQRGCGPNRYGPSKYMDPASYPIYWMELVGTFADSRGQIVGRPFKVGNGPVDVSVPSGAARVQLGANYCDYGNARNFFTPLSASVTGPPPAVLQPAGTMAHLAVGGLWKTTIVLVNHGTAAAQARLNFFDGKGNALALPIVASDLPGSPPVAASTIDRTLASGTSLTLEAEDRSTEETRTGWAQLLTDGDLGGFAIFGMRVGNYDQEALVPLETRSAEAYVLWFHNSDAGGFVTSLAFANISAEQVSVSVTARDESGVTIGTETIVLAPREHIAFELQERLPQTGNRRGTVEFRTAAGGRLSVLGLRFNRGAFTTIPLLAR